MNPDQSNRLALAFARELAAAPAGRLCSTCADVLDVDGAGITLLGGVRSGPVCVSNERMATLEDLQFTSGEGPCQDAFSTASPVHAPRLDATAFARWPSFVDLAMTTGVGAVFAFPMSTTNAKVGVLTLYRDQAGELTTGQRDDSVAIAELLAETVLSLQDAAPEGALAVELEDAAAHRAEVHQASGMVAVQLRVPVAEALARIRAHAFAHSLPVGIVAAEIVGRRLRFSPDDTAEERP